MNFIFISPNFPHTYWNFCDRLKKNGVNVLGIGDAPYDGLEDGLKGALTEYYKVDSLENYDQVFRAVAFFSFKYGKIDWLESNNEHWLANDARLRRDFNITTGVQPEELALWKSKSAMKPVYHKAGIPTARNHKVTEIDAAKAFLKNACGILSRSPAPSWKNAAISSADSSLHMISMLCTAPSQFSLTSAA